MQGFWVSFGATFAAVFVAELGDKTQLAALGLSATSERPWAVFAGSAAALVLASAIAVLLGRVFHSRTRCPATTPAAASRARSSTRSVTAPSVLARHPA